MKIDENIELQLLSLDHTEELYDLVDSNRQHLRQWLPWLDANTSPSDTEYFIKSVISQYESGKGPQYAMFYDAAMCGVCGFHQIDEANKIGSIGYWLSKAHSGKGIMTKSVMALIEIGFRDYGFNRIEIACATENSKSRAIPERLGFKLEGVFRERHKHYGKYVDLAIYSMLAAEFRLNKTFQRTKR
ncbi:GNAT family N-acetyltransferase [Methylophaga sp.]|uniref:GNAT family N-acetyltransferase n=1 Tax=Methylophaga sp. TaxID=2024840 RepID=UPI002722E97A|nr:GNAT family protein [Methylophaga sp.]MDO8827577.1 GNAT family protein [Methylophaga sp.]